MQDKSVEVSNFDVLRLGLRKELSLLKEKLDKSASSRGGINLALDINGMQDLMEMIYKLMEVITSVEYRPTINVESPEMPEISIPNITIPEIKVPDIYVPAPQVTVNAPEVNVDLRGVIQALDNLKYLSDRANKPLSVRMSDGKKFVQAIESLKKATDNLGVVYAGSSGGASSDDLRNIGLGSARSIGNGSKTVTTHGTAERVVSIDTPCRWVIVVGKGDNTSTVWIGGESVASGSGVPLLALQSERFDISNLNNLYIDSEVDGEGVTFTYGN